MKLVQYDEKHESAREELDLGNISSEQEVLIQKILDWMGSKEVCIFSRHNSAVLCNDYKYVEHYGEKLVKFN